MILRACQALSLHDMCTWRSNCVQIHALFFRRLCTLCVDVCIKAFHFAHQQCGLSLCVCGVRRLRCPLCCLWSRSEAMVGGVVPVHLNCRASGGAGRLAPRSAKQCSDDREVGERTIGHVMMACLVQLGHPMRCLSKRL